MSRRAIIKRLTAFGSRLRGQINPIAEIEAVLEAIPGKRRSEPPISAGGYLMVGSEAFRQVCAIRSDGTYYFVPDRNDVTIAEELDLLGRQFLLPPVTDKRRASLADIARMQGRSGSVATGVPLTPGARRMQRVLAEAARLKAGDVKLIERSAHADLRIKIGHKEFKHGDEWPLSEAQEAIAWLYDGRDYGDGAAAQQAGKHQSFSVSKREGRIALPEGVEGLRGQKGPQGGSGDDYLVLRLIYASDRENAGNLEMLGFEEDVLAALEAERASENGLVIIGGSTGDGKSTTLQYQMIRTYQERDGEISIMTIEDPIEYPIDGSGIIQMTVESAAEGADRGAAFTRVLRAFLRCNPNIGMVHEIRTADDAREILQFVISGHKVFTTIHSFSANAVLFRLISLGVDPKELAEPGVVNLVMRQRLVSTLCQDCALEPTPEQHRIIADWCQDETARPKLRNLAGCETCLKGRSGETTRAAWGGLAGKRATAEFIQLDDTYRRFVEARDPLGAREYWLKPRSEGGLGGITVEDRMRRLVARGEIDFEDASNITLPGRTSTTAGPTALHEKKENAA